jgi:hypothetical protein
VSWRDQKKNTIFFLCCCYAVKSTQWRHFFFFFFFFLCAFYISFFRIQKKISIASHKKYSHRQNLQREWYKLLFYYFYSLFYSDPYHASPPLDLYRSTEKEDKINLKFIVLNQINITEAIESIKNRVTEIWNKRHEIWSLAGARFSLPFFFFVILGAKIFFFRFMFFFCSTPNWPRHALTNISSIS